MKFSSLSTLLASKKVPPVLVLHGDEDFLIEEALAAVLAAYVDPALKDLNCDILDGSECSVEHVVEMASSFPMMAARRVVVIKNFDKFAAAKLKKADSAALFQRYISKPSDTTLLILCGPSPESKSSSKKSSAKAKATGFSWPALLDASGHLEFPRLYDRDIPSWIAGRVEQQRRTISPEACEFMIAQVGTSLRDLHNELTKLDIWLGKESPKITVDDVSALAGASKTWNVFELQKAVGRRDMNLSISIFRKMMTAERQEMLVLTMITRFFMTLWKLKDVSQRTRNHQEIAKAVGVNQYFLPEYLGAAGMYSLEEIEDTLRILCDLDESLKSSSSDSEILVHSALIAILRKRT